MKKIYTSLAVIAAVAMIVAGATGAWFSDEETSTGNVFAAGAIDLLVDDHCYYNGQECVLVTDVGYYWNGVEEEGNECGCTWDLDDINGHLYFDFDDVKPGDFGEDTISLHVNNNDAWVCASIDMTMDDDLDCTDPEDTDDLACDVNDASLYDGELADNLYFMWWADDGDNVLEDNEQVEGQYVEGSLEDLVNDDGPYFGNIANTMLLTIADSVHNFYDVGNNVPLEGGVTYYIGKAWCFGDMTITPVPQPDGPGTNPGDPLVDAGFKCSGEFVDNASQTDRVEADISFEAFQARNTDGFLCPEHELVTDGNQ